MDNIGFALTAGGIIVTSGTAFWIGYLHRRQMRQVELYRVDPKAGLVPVATTFEKGLKAAGLIGLMFILPIAGLIYDLSKSGPITRTTIAQIAIDISLLFTDLGLIAIMWMGRKLTAVFIEALRDLAKTSSQLFEMHTAAIKTQGELISELTKVTRSVVGQQEKMLSKEKSV